ncbi:MAG: DUF3471 domain-containing protein [Chitinophagaceae bacterium]
MRKFLLFFFATGSSFILSAQQTPPADSLKEYTGSYKFPEGSDVTEIKVVAENGVLWANSVKGNSELKKIEKDVFEVVSYTGTATFKRDEKGKVNVLHIEVGRLIMDGTKSEEPSPQQSDKLQRSPNR